MQRVRNTMGALPRISPLAIGPGAGPVQPVFGWAEIERGSLTVNRLGFQTVSGVGAPATAVPVPQAFTLLGTGLAALAAFARGRRGG